MGRAYTEGLLNEGLDLDTALNVHLQYNHYPPISLEFVSVAKLAIEFAELGSWDTIINMPNGKALTVSEIVEGLHLDTFLSDLDY